jgi:hypothetical protein
MQLYPRDEFRVDPAAERQFLRGPLLSEAELENAKALVRQLTSSPIVHAVRFRNALHGFIEDGSRNTGAQPFSQILCVDTTEVYSWAVPNASSMSGFGFGSLTGSDEDAPNTTDRLVEEDTYQRFMQSFDQIILQHLLFERQEGFGLLDPHAEEISIIFAAAQRSHERAKDVALRSLPPSTLSLNNDQLNSIRTWVLGQQDDKTISEEFNQFRATFLPAWRDGLIYELGRLRRGAQRFEKFFRDGKYSFLSPASHGERALVDRIAKYSGINIDRRDLAAHLETEESRTSFNEVRRIVIELSRTILDPGSQSPDIQAESVRRDAEAIAHIHVLNTYLRRNEMPARIELVTRSARLHSIAAVLPPSRIWFGLRHPLFMPNIYSFPPGALDQMASLMQSVDHALRPWLDPLKQRTLGPENEAEQKQVAEEVGVLCRKLVEVLADFVTIQDTLDKGEVEAGKLVQRATTARDASGKKLELDTSAILDTFDALIEVLRERRDPYSKEVLSSIRSKIKSLVTFELARLSDDKTLNATYNQVEAHDEPGLRSSIPASCTQFRFVDSELPRVIQLHSEKVAGLVLPATRSAVDSANARHYHCVPAKDLLKSFLADDMPPASLEHVESALACAATLAALGRFTSAGAIASSVLHLVTTQIRTGKKNELNLSSADRPILMALAFKELFLLRYYCECVVALQDLDVLLRYSKSLARPEGGAVKNFARAQRDLNFAVHLNERASLLMDARLPPGWDHVPAGLPYLEDLRLPIVRFDGWLQQFIMLWRFGYMDEPDPLAGALHRQLWGQRRRAILWAAEGFIKDVEAVAFRAATVAQQYRAGGSERPVPFGNIRYFSYVEARALQHLNIALAVFLAFDISREVQGLWNPEVALSYDHLLFFRNWRFWRSRFEALDGDYDFKFRTNRFTAPILAAVISIDQLREVIADAGKMKPSGAGRARRRNIEWKQNYVTILNDLKDQMQKLDDTGPIEDKLFLRYVREAVIKKADTLANRATFGLKQVT